MNDLIEALGDSPVADSIRAGADVPDRNCSDSSGLTPSSPAAILLPETTEQVAHIVATCQRLGKKVVVQGGMTGLAGGARPLQGEIALSLERMQGIEEIDTASRTMTVLAGTTLEAVQRAAEEAGLFYGVDLGARGSCTIGGNVATNAGGVQVLRYGMTRRNVLGLEAVLADGRVVRSLNKMLKNNAGYDWTQLFIGSEGTLGVVTKVVLALQPRPEGIESALCAVKDVDAALTVLRRIEARFSGRLMVFEAMWREYMEAAARLEGLKPPFTEPYEITLLIECALGDTSSERDTFSEVLSELMESEIIADAIVAQSGQARKRLWAYREANNEFARVLPPAVHFDVGIPLSRMGWSIDEWRTRIVQRWPHATFIAFGHMADCNLHLSVHLDDPTVEHHTVEELIYEVVGEARGSISAEHGIGTIKRPYLNLSRSEEEIDMMRMIKDALDPSHILNPGRVI